MFLPRASLSRSLKVVVAAAAALIVVIIVVDVVDDDDVYNDNDYYFFCKICRIKQIACRAHFCIYSVKYK